MPRIPGIRRLFRAPELSSVEREVEDELRFHFEMRAQHRRADWWEAAWLDLRYAARGLRRTPGFTAVVVLTLALGLGANATMFGVVDRLLLRPPAHVRDPESVVRIHVAGRGRDGEEFRTPWYSYPVFADIRDGTPSFAHVAALSSSSLSMGQGPDAVEVRASLVSASFFPLLGVRPALGRFFTEEEDRLPRGSPVAVLSHGFWRRQFAGDPAVVGRSVRLSRDIYTIVGVAPEGFSGVGLDAVDVWVPISTAAGDDGWSEWATSRGSVWLTTIARVRPGATPERAAMEATLALRRGEAGSPFGDTTRSVTTGSIIAAKSVDAPREVRVSLWVGGVSLLVLLLSCTNIANLLLARALRRRREIAVRLALGVSRARLARQLLTESLVIAALAGVGALGVAYVGGRLLRALIFRDVAWPTPPVDGRVLAFTGAAVLATGLLIGLAPVLQASAPDLTRALRAGAHEGGSRRSRTRAVLLGVQAALALLLLAGAGLFVRSLRNVRALDLGVDLDRTLMATMDLERAGVPDAQRAALYREMLQRVRALPGVERAALAAGNPFQSGSGIGPWTDERPREAIWRPGMTSALLSRVGSGYFSTVGARSLRGRDFTESDRLGAPLVAVINEPMARLLWPGKDPLGRCMRTHSTGGACVEVVGVLRSVWKMRLLDRDRMAVYFPLSQDSTAVPATLYVRARGDAAAVAPTVRRAMQSVRGDLPVASVQLMRDVADPETRSWRLGATAFTLFGALALAIAAIGLYSVAAFMVVQRTHEIGVRMALGASGGDVVRLVMAEGLRVTAAGLAAGAVVALAAGRWVAPLLYQTSPRDPAVFAGVALTLLAVAVAASLVPSWRATRVPPGVALRAE